MIELLVVLLIIGVLAAIAAPMFLGNTMKAKAAEAVSVLGSIRGGERVYSSQNGAYLVPITDGAVYFGTATGNKSQLLGVQVTKMAYFSPEAFTVTAAGSMSCDSITGQDYLIKVDGSKSKGLAIAGPGGTNATDGARKASDGDITSLRLEMDNTGYICLSTDAGSSWTKY